MVVHFEEIDQFIQKLANSIDVVPYLSDLLKILEKVHQQPEEHNASMVSGNTLVLKSPHPRSNKS
jgi:hypothetical protein